MPKSFTSAFNIDSGEFDNTGALDIILDVDSKFFIDIKLLETPEDEEFFGSVQKIEKHFSNIITLLSHSTKEKDQFWNGADKLLAFKEIQGTCLGYSSNGVQGNAIGAMIRKRILVTIKELIEAGEKDPVILELLGVFQEGVGSDRVSDLITFILSRNIYSYSQRISLSIKGENTLLGFNLDNVEYKLFMNPFNSQPILFLPKTILSPLPIAMCYSDIDIVCDRNRQVRLLVNQYFNWHSFKKNALNKKNLSQLFLSNPKFREEFLLAYKNEIGIKYDFAKDPNGEISWYLKGKEFSEKYPIELDKNITTIEDVELVVLKICDSFKRNIEEKGAWKILYRDDKHPNHESFSQLLFFTIADSYCTANNLDLSRESNSGNGSVDFKMSSGNKSKVLVEIKLSSNSQLIHCFDEQIPLYMAQEETMKAIYLLINVDNDKKIENLKKHIEETSKGNQKISLIIVDGKVKKSASVR